MKQESHLYRQYVYTVLYCLVSWFILVVLCGILTSRSAYSTEIHLAGIMSGNKALISVDGAKPKMYQSGQRVSDNVKLLSVSDQGIQVSIDGGGSKYIPFGGPGAVLKSALKEREASLAVTKIPLDQNGHFMTDGMLNGQLVSFLVDTGASVVTLNQADANRLNINYRKYGVRTEVLTANGKSFAWSVPNNKLQIGNITVENIDVQVAQGDLSSSLLGMNFLNHVNLSRKGGALELRKMSN